jgi:hypothetical protein
METDSTINKVAKSWPRTSGVSTFLARRCVLIMIKVCVLLQMPAGFLLRRCQNAHRSTSGKQSGRYQEVQWRYVRHPKYRMPRWHPDSLRLISPHGRRPPSHHGRDRPPCVDSALYSPFPLVPWRALLGGRTEYQVLECSQYS